MMKKSRKKIMIFSVIAVLALSILATVVFSQTGTAAYKKEKVQTGDITTYYSFSGAVDAKRRQNVVSKKEMHVEEVLVKVGDQVKKDDVLLVNSEGEETRAEIDGEVAAVFTKNNSHALKGSQLIDIVSYEDLHVKVKVDEYDLKYVTVDQEVDVTINALEQEITGKVYAISREATNENGISYFTAMIDFNEEEAIRIGMSAETKILKDQALGIQTLSMKAIQFDSKNNPYVMLSSEKGEPAKQYIETGINDGTTIEIKSGVQLGDTIIVPKQTNGTAVAMHGGGN
jgi:multidrug efflux pump subunit AcrA (membrane-fusion protein)